ncbi:MAG: feruloyl-CoA synthase, partial [Pseudomonadota bacterium]
DPNQPEKGLAFDGRTAEEFKLANGTWVSAGKLRVQAVEAVDGVLADAVVCGLNQNEVCLLGFINEGFCQRLVGAPLPMNELIAHAKVIDAVRAGLETHNAQHPNAAGRIARIILQATPPQSDAGEITEKGYINQNKAQSLRTEDVSKLYDSGNSSDVIIL